MTCKSKMFLKQRSILQHDLYNFQSEAGFGLWNKDETNEGYMYLDLFYEMPS